MHWLILFALVRVLRERDELKKALTCFKATMKQNRTLLEKPSAVICRSQTLRKCLIYYYFSNKNPGKNPSWMK